MRPLIKRSRYFDHFPQLPGWFFSMAHIEARETFKKKLKSRYSYESKESCPLCGNRETLLIADQERHGLPIQVLACTNCCLLRTSPRLDFSSLSDHYNSDAQQLKRGAVKTSHEQLFELQKSKARKIVEFLRLAQAEKKADLARVISVAEVGCGEGGGVGIFRDNFGSAKGFELYAAAVEYGRQKGLELFAFEFGDLFPRQKFDLIVYEQVFEHILDLEKELGIIAEAQEVGGYLYIGVPGLLHIESSYDSNLLAYLEYQHAHHFTLNTLERFLNKHGYRLVSGNQVIQAIFEKQAPGTEITPTTSPLKISEIKEFLLDQEKKFQGKAGVPATMHLKYFAKTVLFKLGLRGVTRT